MANLPRKGWRKARLQDALESQDPQARLEALRLLGERGNADPEGVIPMLADPDPMVRQTASIVVGAAAWPAAVPHLVELLAGDDDEETNRYAAWALRRVPEEERLVRLAGVFKSATGRAKRIAAMELRRHRYMPIVDELTARFASTGRLSWREVDHATVEDIALLGYYAAEPLASLLQSNDLRVQVNAALALGRIGDGRFASPLALAMRSTAPEARPSIGAALVELGGDAVTPVAELLEDDDKEVRLTAAQVLGNIGEPAVIVLLEALRRRDPHNLEEVIYALGLTHSPAAFYPLLKTYEVGRDDKVKAWTMLALALVCAHNYPQVEEKQDLFRALNIVKDSLAPHDLLDSETLLELGKAFLYSNRFTRGAETFKGNLEKALTCFSISRSTAPSPQATLYHTFIDAYLRALGVSSKEVLEFLEAGVRRELGVSEYPLESHAFNRYIGVLLFMLRELEDAKGKPQHQHFEDYIAALGRAEHHMGQTAALPPQAAAVLHAAQGGAEDKVTYQMQERIDRLMGRVGDDPAAVSLLQQLSLEMMKAETGLRRDFTHAQLVLKEMVSRLPIRQEARSDLAFQALEVSKMGMPQVGAVLDGIELRLHRRLGRGVKAAIAVAVVLAAAAAAVAALEYLKLINVLPWF